MGGFRDDREALRARIEALEAELRSGGPDRQEVLERLGELTSLVAETRKRIDSDRAELGDLVGRIEALRRELRGGEGGPWPDADEGGARPASLDEAQRMRSRLGVGCVLLLLIGSCGIWALSARHEKQDSYVDTSHFPSLLYTAGELPGGTHAFDPMALLDRVHSYAPSGAELSSMELHYVGNDGTVDLDHPAYQASVEYRLEIPMGPGRDRTAAPLGAPQPLPTVHSALYRVDSQGLHPDSLGMVGGLVPTPSRGTVGDPHCTPAQVWSAAADAGAPEDAVAQLSYGRAGFGLAHRPADYPLWTFSIEGTGIELRVDDADCRVIGGSGLPDADQPDAGSADAAAEASR